MADPKFPFHEPRFPQEVRDVDSKNLSGISDLVIFAPIKSGFIDAFGNVTYESRLKIVAEALHKLRKNVREYQLFEPFADPTKRILSLLDFRIGIIDRDLYGFGRKSEADGACLRPRKYLYLTATFDGAWEPYMRLIWRPLGYFLDLVLCNCDGYKPALTTGYSEYIAWVRDHLLDTAIFYAVSDHTVKDGLYLADVERIQREIFDPSQREEMLTLLQSRHPDEDAAAVKLLRPIETLKLGLEGLNVLYQLTRFYPPDSKRDGQGIFLHKATHEFLQYFDFKTELSLLGKKSKQFAQIEKLLRKNYFDPLAWYHHKYVVGKVEHRDEPANASEVQKGILTNYEPTYLTGPITNGAVGLLRITDPKRAAALLNPIYWSWEGQSLPFYRNVAMTASGFEKLGLTEKEIKTLPKEFRQGMEERAPLLGDKHHNHPQRWTLPERNMLSNDEGSPYEGPKPPAVSLNEVDLVIQIRMPNFWNSTEGEEIFVPFEDADWLIADEILDDTLESFNKGDIADLDILMETFFEKALLPALKDGLDEKTSLKGFGDGLTGLSSASPAHLYLRLLQRHGPKLGVEILSVQSTFRPGTTPGSTTNAPKGFGLSGANQESEDILDSSDIPTHTRDHFGFRDGISQPVIKEDLKYPAKQKASAPLDVKLGDVLLGYSTMLGDFPKPVTNDDLFRNGSFLAIRKIRQNVGEFNRFLNTQSGEMKPSELAAKLMGRDFDGIPLVKGGSAKDNDFDFSADKEGRLCPVVSHIRRTNPRAIEHDRKSPKIVRRGMSYGPAVSPEAREGTDYDGIDQEDRGVLFMAYCSNLAEQYETIQRWVNGANSHNVGGAQADPIFSPLPRDGRSVVRIPVSDPKTGAVSAHRAKRRTTDCPHSNGSKQKVSPRPFTALEWGLYAFAPSYSALEIIVTRLRGDTATGDLIDRVAQGRKTVKAIEALPNDYLKQREWKILLEDFVVKDPAQNNITPMVWDYLRSKNGGVFRINSGVEGQNAAESSQPVLLVTEASRIAEVLKSPGAFSSAEIGLRLEASFGAHHVGMDPGPRYEAESKDANEVFFGYSKKTAFALAHGIAKTILDRRILAQENILTLPDHAVSPFKMELTREYIAPFLAELSKAWFGLPEGTHFEKGAWAWDMTSSSDRKPRCPGDFLAPSRGSFYPRPTEAVTDYSNRHGEKLRKAINALVAKWRAEKKVHGVLSQELAELIPDDDLLGRNIIGSMIGMLPPMDANIRSVMFDWTDKKTLWALQGRLFAEAARTGASPRSYELAKQVVDPAIARSMSLRPAPDLLYRTATKDGNLNGIAYKKGDLVILSLVSGSQSKQHQGIPNVDVIFGGKRSDGANNPEGNPHACPAQKMVMGALLGCLTALLNVGRIQSMPASLIIEISDW